MPAFSIFSALSEILVTVVVLATVLANLRGRPLRWRLLGVVLAFELAVNVVYMAGRASQADADRTLSPGLKAFFAAHGILSLAMFVWLAAVFLISVVDLSGGRETWFVRHRRLCGVLLALWLVSVLSGEVIFASRYLL